MTATASPFVLGPQAAALRRKLGPLAWCALECLAERADRSRGGAVAEASVRSIAVELGVAKNTAHRAIGALARAGLVSPVQDRDDDGRFRVGRYVLRLGDLVTTAPPKPSRPRPAPSGEPTQLTLLELT